MAKDPAFLFYPGDYLRDTQCLSEKSQVAYDRIMCEHMRNICASYENHMYNHTDNIGITKQQLNFFIKRLNEDEKKELMFVLTKTGDIYQIEWVAESLCKRRSYTESRSKNRKGKPKNISTSYDNHMENAIENENINENYLGKSENPLQTNPKKEEVERVFIQQGGTKEMALAFFNRYEAVEWKIRGTSIKNFTPLIGTFITNWKSNENANKSITGSNGSHKLGTSEARIKALKEWGSTGTGKGA